MAHDLIFGPGNLQTLGKNVQFQACEFAILDLFWQNKPDFKQIYGNDLLTSPNCGEFCIKIYNIVRK